MHLAAHARLSSPAPRPSNGRTAHLRWLPTTERKASTNAEAERPAAAANAPTRDALGGSAWPGGGREPTVQLSVPSRSSRSAAATAAERGEGRRHG